MKVRITSGGEEPKGSPKVRVKKAATPSLAELEAANKFAKDLAARKGLVNAESFHVGNQIPKFIDDRTGKEATQGNIIPGVGKLSATVPSYVKSLEWDDQKSMPYYVDQSTGYMQYVPKDLFYSPRFNPNKGQSLLLAKR